MTVYVLVSFDGDGRSVWGGPYFCGVYSTRMEAERAKRQRGAPCEIRECEIGL